MSDRVRSGIIGAGFMGGVHARAVWAAGGQVVAVAGGDMEESAAAAARFHADQACGSAAELLASDIDLVHICTPNHLHAPLTKLALAAGKHVICEKPIATSVADANELVQAAQEAGVVAAVPFVYRFYASVREARARISNGESGDLRFIHGSYLQDWLSRAQESNWRVDPAQGGGSRAFGDIGVHWVDLVEFVTGHRIVQLSAQFMIIPREVSYSGRPTEDGATVMFETDRGAKGSVVISQVSPGRKNRLWFEIDGADRAYSFDQESPDSLWIGDRGSSTVLPRAAEDSVGPSRYDMVPTGHPQGYQDSFTNFIADVHAAVGGEMPEGLPQFTDGLRAAVVTEAVIESAHTSAWVQVPE